MIQELQNKTIGVFCGGVSQEREVSLRSGAHVYKILTQGGYNAVLIDLTKRSQVAQLIKDHQIDIVFNTLHGYYGEDGRFQAILEDLNIPYTGCNMESSSISMDKLLTKLIAKSLGIPVASYTLVKANQKLDKTILKPYLPFIIKPQKGGSSVETYLVKDENDLHNLHIHNENLEFLVEQFVKGKEVTAGVLSHGKESLALPILELASSNAFYDYEAKYTQGKTEFILPANISSELTQKIQEYSVLMHETLGCHGATRCDFIIENDVPYFLELNSSPGMTELSDVPAEALSYGMTLLELCEWILKSALSRL